MEKLPGRHTAEEFSLRILWRPCRSIRSTEKGTIPGFHLTAGFANEGEAHWVAEDVRLGVQALTNTLTMLSSDPSVDSALMNLGGPLAHAHDEALRHHHQNLVRRARELRAELEAAEAAVHAAGLGGVL